MKVVLTANAFGHKKGETIDIATNMAHYFIREHLARIPPMPMKSKAAKRKATARKRKRADSPLNKMTTATDNK